MDYKLFEECGVIPRDNKKVENWFYLKPLFDIIYNYEIKGIEILENYSRSPYILLAKHQSIIDIVLEQILLQRTRHDYGYYIMKSSGGLQELFNGLGGIALERDKEIRKIKNRDEKKLAIFKAKKKANLVYSDLIPHILDLNNPVIIHPEGTRKNYDELTFISDKKLNSNLATIINLYNSLENKVPIIAIDFNYNVTGVFNKNVNINIAQPLIENNLSKKYLEDYLVQNIRTILK